MVEESKDEVLVNVQMELLNQFQDSDEVLKEEFFVEEIMIDDFVKVDLCVVCVINVECVEEVCKLLKFMFLLGGEYEWIVFVGIK